MPVLLTVALPTRALARVIDGYRSGDPELIGMLKEFRVLAMEPEDEPALGVWENEGGRRN